MTIKDGWMTAKDYANSSGQTESDVIRLASSKWMKGVEYLVNGSVLMVNAKAIEAWMRSLLEPRNADYDFVLNGGLAAVMQKSNLCFQRGWDWLETYDKDAEYLYVMSCGEFLKVGLSVNPLRRLKDHQVSNPVEIHLELVYRPTVFMPISAIEAVAHRSLKQYHVRGEWFTKDAMAEFKRLDQAQLERFAAAI
ncbi:MAG: GIY-YIG nuclease family protein [Pseudomonadota bacterium]